MVLSPGMSIKALIIRSLDGLAGDSKHWNQSVENDVPGRRDNSFAQICHLYAQRCIQFIGTVLLLP
jgi:hypothetical protein